MKHNYTIASSIFGLFIVAGIAMTKNGPATLICVGVIGLLVTGICAVEASIKKP